MSKDGLYRVSDKLIKQKGKIEKKLLENEADVFGIYLYDLTSGYFEGRFAIN